MFVRFLMTGLLLLSGMRGLQACIGEAGHFHLELAHSHADHCHGHSHPVEQSPSPQCEHSDDHFHVDFSIDDPINQSTHRIALQRGQPRVLATLPPVFPQSALLGQFPQRPSEISRMAKPFRNAALSTIVLRL